MAQPSEHKNGCDSGVEILLVEHSAPDAELTIRVLKKNNMADNLIHVENGAEALDFISGGGKFADRDLLAVPKDIFSRCEDAEGRWIGSSGEDPVR